MSNILTSTTVIRQLTVYIIMFKLSESFEPMLKSIAFVCSKLNDGLSVEQISNYMKFGDLYDKQFVSFCVRFAVENKWLESKNKGDRYSLTALGKEFISIQFG